MAKEVKSALASLTGLSFGDKHKGDKDKEKAEKDAAEKDKTDKAAQFASMKDSDVTKSRRRLSVVAATGAKQHILDGVGEGAPNEKGESTPGLKCFDKFSLYSHVGFVPFNTAKVNQDRGVAVAPYCKTDEKAFFGVFDGHGALGHEVSSYVQKNLCEEIAKQPNLDSDPEAALTKGFVDCNAKLAKGSVDCTFSGTTVIVCYLHGKTLYSANAGDSRAVLARNEDGKMMAIPLSSDQKPEREDEAKRIKACQGRVEACKGPRGEEIGPQRVWLLHQDVPGLAMTRSFGDLIAASVGVIPTPEVWKRTLDAKDKFMILASDGVWEFISSQEAVDIVAKCKDGEEACKALYEESTRRWRAEEEVVDDITCLIVYFNHEA